MAILDKVSRRILQELQINSHRSVQELADRVGLSSTPCWRRVRELEQSGVIRRYTALVDREKIGLQTCVLAHVTLARNAEGVVDQFEAAMQACPDVVECYGTTGDVDYVIKVMVPDIKAYDAFLHGTIFKIPGVANIRSNMVLREVKYETALPL
jgi:Lrp/AsnC family transcriptional regulator, leucine-responsive regulatory protein